MTAVMRALKPATVAQVEEVVRRRAKTASAREWLRFVVHEPFFQFIALGLLIWCAVEYWTAHNDRYTIHVGPADRQRIATTYLQQFGQSPNPEQLRGLMDRYVREEIFLREGLSLNLDKDDEIVRRRIIQKYEFLQTDLAIPDSPGSGVLESWYEEHKSRYLVPERVALTQVYFSTDNGGEEAARERALEALERLRGLRAARAPDLGDPFPGPSDVGALAPEEALRLFGQSEFSEQLFMVPVGRWMGPYRSGYGWHLVYVTGVSPPVLPPLTTVRERVLADYHEEQQRIANARAFERLRAKYTIRYDGVTR